LTAQDGSSSIHIRFTNSINTDNALSQEVNMVVNNMTKKKLRSLKLISFARSYYYPDPKPVRVRYNDRTPEDQKFQLQMYKGFMATVQPSLRGMIMTVDLTSRIMQQESIRDQLTRYEMEARRQHMSKSQYMAKMQEIYTGAVVLAQYNRRIWRIDEIDFSKNINSEFEKKDGSKISFKQYYSETYSEVKQKIMNVQPKPGLLVNRPKKARTTKQETILLPELCYLTGVTDLMRKNNSLMKALADVTRMSPNQRVKDITELMGNVMKNSPPPPGKEPLPIQIGSKPIEVKGRVLGPFNIVMPRNKKRLDDNKGFANDVRSCGFFGGRPSVRSWGCIFDKADQRTAQQVIANIQQIGNQQGAQIARGIPLAIQGPAKDVKSWGMAIQKMMTKKPEFILIIVPRSDPLIYSFVKHWTLTKTGVVSQCMSTTTLANFKMMKPVCGNTFKQIMSKLGYENWRVNIQEYLPPAARNSTMFVGVDVSHDKLIKNVYGGSRARRSTVGFTSSRDEYFNTFNSFISYQSPDTELITEASVLMNKAMQAYYKQNKKFPAHVVVYRDGVGDSQLTTFVRLEIKNYEAAFNKLGVNPKLTVIVVQKRINLRLFSACPLAARTARKCPFSRKCQGRERYHSPMAGTIVDNTITSSLLSDFFLVPSLAPPKATARPTRFIVLRDDIGFSTDNLQNMTNQMCYMYFNWPGPIRVPACVMYAHKLAYLFGKHVTGEPHAQMQQNLFYL